MKVTERPDYADALLCEAESHYGDYEINEDLVHAKETVSCLRKAFYDRNEPSERGFLEGLTPQTRTKIALGVAFGHLVNADEDELTELVELPDGHSAVLVGHVDNTWREGDVHVPIEIKVTWSWGSDISDQYFEQLASYANGYGVNRGIIAIVRVSQKGGPELHAYEVIFTDRELADWRRESQRRAAAILGSTPPSLLEHYRWECETATELCRYYRKAGGNCEGGVGKSSGWFSQSNTAARRFMEDDDSE